MRAFLVFLGLLLFVGGVIVGTCCTLMAVQSRVDHYTEEMRIQREEFKKLTENYEEEFSQCQENLTACRFGGNHCGKN